VGHPGKGGLEPSGLCPIYGKHAWILEAGNLRAVFGKKMLAIRVALLEPSAVE